MNLVKSRNEMLDRWKNGERPVGLLDDYDKYRDTEEWRTGRVVEELLEYILYLESKLKINIEKG